MLLDYAPIALVIFILGFGMLVFIHELGHFLVAKWVGIKCTQFAIGFGPSLVSWRKGIGFRAGSTEAAYQKRINDHLAGQEKQTVDFEEQAAGDRAKNTARIDRAAAELGLGETEYRLNPLPLGGYVKMLGQEDADPSARSDDPRAFNMQPIWARMCVISAGVVMNAILGMVLFVAAFMIGVGFPAAVVGGLVPNMPADSVYARGHKGDPAYRGLRLGDRITKVDGERVRDMTDVMFATAVTDPGQSVSYTVQRPGARQPLVFTLVPKRGGGSENFLSMGVVFPQNLTIDQVKNKRGKMVPGIAIGSPLEKLGLRAGMKLVQAGGRAVDTQYQLHRALVAGRGRPVPVVFKDPGTGKTIQAHLAAVAALSGGVGDTPMNLLGLAPTVRFDPMPKSPAAKAGVKKGDLVASLQGQPWPRMRQVHNLVANAEGPVRLTVLRGGKTIKLDPITPEEKKIGGKTRRLIGVQVTRGLGAPVLGSVLPKSPFASLHLPGGARIHRVNGRPIHDWTDLQGVFTALNRDKPAKISLRFTPPGDEGAAASAVTKSITLTPGQLAPLARARWLMPEDVTFEIRQTKVQSSNPLKATVIGFDKTIQVIGQTYMTLVGLFRGSVHMTNLRGPVGIAQAGTRVAKRGWAYMLFFLGLISVNLAVINFLPIPIVDGGHALFLLIEKIKGSPLSVRMQTAATVAGLVVLGSVFLVVTYNDIARLITG